MKTPENLLAHANTYADYSQILRVFVQQTIDFLTAGGRPDVAESYKELIPLADDYVKRCAAFAAEVTVNVGTKDPEVVAKLNGSFHGVTAGLTDFRIALERKLVENDPFKPAE